ncbi:MAG: flagellar biosynthesis anti-sigma factor FlgM [Armatimonadota bacterium]
MYVNNAQINSVLELHLHKVYSVQNKPAISASMRPADELVLSSRATEMQDIKQAMSALPDVRTDLVDNIKSKVEAGAYDSSNQDIADCMLRSIIGNLG